MKKIIALKGKHNCGKTTTIGMLHELLVNSNKYELTDTTFKKIKKDFISVFKKGNITIGITSKGDTEDLVGDALKILIEIHKSNICICACRTSGGTHVAIDGYTEYESIFIDKTHGIDEAHEKTANTNDAKKLFDMIEQLTSNN